MRQNERIRVIRLVGPGGAGKSTVGAALAASLRLPFVDLDREFEVRVGSIDAFIDSQGYEAYARRNVSTYREIVDSAAEGVVALSSGFMAYPPTIDSAYPELCDAIGRDPTTFVLIPSLELEICVAETVRRQLARQISNRTAAREEAVIRERFGIYTALPATKVETMRPAHTVVAEISACL